MKSAIPSIGSAFIAVISLNPAGYAFAENPWTFDYSVGSGSDEITSCNAGIWYNDAALVARIYGEEMDFFFANKELSLPSEQKLGSVAFSFKSGDFVLSAWSSQDDSGQTSSMLLAPDKNDYGQILNALRFSEKMSVIFPDGTGYTIPMDGSDSALQQAFACWKQKPTGPAGRNPFVGVKEPEGKNPFN